MTARHASRAVLWTSLAIGAALRVWLAFHDDGVYWPDEIYQSIEPAHRLVFGYGLIAWEFLEGAGSWALPALVAVPLQLSDWLGLDDPSIYLVVIRLLFVASSLGCAAAVYFLSSAYGARPLSAAVGAALAALFAPFYFSPRALSEGASALPAVLGFALAIHPRASRRQVVVGASLVGLSVLLRLHCALFACALVVILLLRRAYRTAAVALGTLTIWAFLLGLIDRLAWHRVPDAYLGGWFHSALKYLTFSLIEGRASAWGTAPWSYYFTTLFSCAPVMVGLAGLLACMALTRAPGLLGATVFFVGLHAATPHKELRVMVPALPFFWALAAIGLDGLAPKTDQRQRPRCSRPPSSPQPGSMRSHLAISATSRIGQTTVPMTTTGQSTD